MVRNRFTKLKTETLELTLSGLLLFAAGGNIYLSNSFCDGPEEYAKIKKSVETITVKEQSKSDHIIDIAKLQQEVHGNSFGQCYRAMDSELSSIISNSKMLDEEGIKKQLTKINEQTNDCVSKFYNCPINLGAIFFSGLFTIFSGYFAYSGFRSLCRRKK